MDEEDFAARQRREEAAQWFARLKTLPVSHGTLEDFFAWRRLPRNAEAFEEAERFWTEAEKVGERPSILRAVQEAEIRGRARRRLGNIPRPLTLFAVGVAVALIVIAGVSLLKPDGRSFVTGTGEQRVIALEDGSRLNLNAESAVSVRYSARGRNLLLKSGEALVNVAKDPERPFTVTAGDITVTATGTRFDVSVREGRTFVTLIEGSVQIRAPDEGPVTLRPGQQWRWPADGPVVRAVRTESVTAWMRGRVVFDDTALADAVAEINRHGGKPVILGAPEFGVRRISGSFEAGDSDSFATAVTAFLPLRRTLDGQGRIQLMAREHPGEKKRTAD